MANGATPGLDDPNRVRRRFRPDREVKCLAYAMVGCTVERNARADNTPKGFSQLAACRIKYGHVVKSGRAWRRWHAPKAFPCVETNMVVIASGRDERGATSEADRKLESEHAAIKLERPLEVCDLQVDVTDAHLLGRLVCYFHRLLKFSHGVMLV